MLSVSIFQGFDRTRRTLQILASDGGSQQVQLLEEEWVTYSRELCKDGFDGHAIVLQIPPYQGAIDRTEPCVQSLYKPWTSETFSNGQHPVNTGHIEPSEIVSSSLLGSFFKVTLNKQSYFPDGFVLPVELATRVKVVRHFISAFESLDLPGEKSAYLEVQRTFVTAGNIQRPPGTLSAHIDLENLLPGQLVEAIQIWVSNTPTLYYPHPFDIPPDANNFQKLIEDQAIEEQSCSAKDGDAVLYSTTTPHRSQIQTHTGFRDYLRLAWLTRRN